MMKGKLGSHMQKKRIRTSLSPYTKHKSKWSKELNLKLEILKLVEIIKSINNNKKESSNLHDINVRNDFQIRPTIVKWKQMIK